MACLRTELRTKGPCEMTFDGLIATMNRLRGEEISVGVYPVPDTDYAVWLDGKVESVVQRPYPVDDRRYDVHLGPGHLQLAESSFRDVILEDDPGEESGSGSSLCGYTEAGAS